MNRNQRNILIAVVLLIILLVMPFWGNIKSALGLTDADSGASPESGSYHQTETKSLSSEALDRLFSVSKKWLCHFFEKAAA